MTSPIITEAVRTLVERRDLTRLEAAAAMEAIMSGAATNAQIAAFLTALRMKGEAVEELIGFAQVMREKVTRIQPRVDLALTGTDREMLIDTCGTGGDASGTFNISTATAFVVAGAGLRVAKHGNRSMSGLTSSSLCGSADVVEALGVNIDLEPAQVDPVRGRGRHRLPVRAAPAHRDEARHGRPARDRHPHRLQPAGAADQPRRRQRPGDRRVPRRRSPSRWPACWPSSARCARSSCTAATTSTSSRTPARAASSEVREGKVRTFGVRPEDFGLPRASIRDLQGGDREQNAQIIRSILAGEPGPKRDIVLMNAAAALVVAGRAQSFKEGVSLAAKSVDSGAARSKLESLVALSQELAPKK